MGERKRPSAHEYDAEKALLVSRPPSGPNWFHELKLDGYRMGVLIRGRSVQLISRRGTEWTADFPEVVEAARRIRCREALLDGEVVMLSARGISDFQALQNRAKSRGNLVYFAFDLLSLNGKDIRREPLERRKALLHDLIGDATGIMRYSEHFEGNGEEVLRRACSLGAEGIVSKRRDAPYHSGARNADWQKIKCIQRQEFVIGGFTDPSGSRVGIGSLLIGYYDDGELRFAGKVGTGKGWSDEFGRTLRRKLESQRVTRSPFEPLPPGWLGRNAHYVKPTLVAEIEFTEWTAGGNIRHPSLQGFRTDKSPRDVVRERAVQPSSATRAKSGGAASKRVAATPDGDGRLVYPETGITKADLAELYAEIERWALPHVVGRPLTLVRCKAPLTREDALRSQCAFLHHTARDQRWAPQWMPRLDIREQKKTGMYLYVQSARDLEALIEHDIVEWHVWNATVDDVEHPDRVVFDLDPGPRVEFGVVADAARLVRDRLSDLELASWVKTTGGKGLHVVVPFRPEHEWADVFEFTRAFAQSIEGEDPDRYTTAFEKTERTGKVLIDYKRNHRTSIAVAGFSPRARPDAGISVPIAWRELTPSFDPGRFTLATIRSRLKRLRSDPWAGFWRSKQRLRLV